LRLLALWPRLRSEWIVGATMTTAPPRRKGSMGGLFSQDQPDEQGDQHSFNGEQQADFRG